MEHSNLDNPTYAAFAWDRYRRLMRWMTLVSLLAAVTCLWVLHDSSGPLPLFMIVVVGLGVFASVLMAAALMGLVFLSNGSGHDDAIADPFKDLNP